MTATLATQAPRLHSLTGTQPVGHKQVATSTEYAGAVTVLYRSAEGYWLVTTRAARNAFTHGSEVGATCAIWQSREDGRYVVDYYEADGTLVDADRTVSLGAAIGVAVSVTCRRWAQSR